MPAEDAHVHIPGPDGQTVDGTPVEIQHVLEPWTECLLADGTRVRIKLVITDAFRLKTRSPDGTPQYLVRSKNVMMVQPVGRAAT
jgi:hypothetical protein